MRRDAADLKKALAFIGDTHVDLYSLIEKGFMVFLVLPNLDQTFRWRVLRAGGDGLDIHRMVTEGFDTADLKDAKAMLDELG